MRRVSAGSRSPSAYLEPPSLEDSASIAASLISLHQDCPTTALISGQSVLSPQLQNGTCCSVHRASVVANNISSVIGPKRLSTIDQEMCGIMQNGICRFSELTPGQFGLTKQLVSESEILSKYEDVIFLGTKNSTSPHNSFRRIYVICYHGLLDPDFDKLQG